MQPEPLLLIQIVIFTVLGGCLGSFATAIIYRELNNQSWWSFATRSKQDEAAPCRSYCPQCQTNLSLPDLIPVLSWLMSGGCCRHCKGKISAFYPLTEMAAIILSVGILFALGFSDASLWIALVIPFLISLLVIDIKQMILPDRLLIGMSVVGAGAVIMRYLDDGQALQTLTDPLVSIIILGGLAWAIKKIAEAILKKPALGMGDVKLFAACGLWVEPHLIGDFFFLCGVLGLLLGVLWRFVAQSRLFPFGPAILCALYIMMITDGSFLIKFII